MTLVYTIYLQFTAGGIENIVPAWDDFVACDTYCRVLLDLRMCLVKPNEFGKWAKSARSIRYVTDQEARYWVGWGGFTVTLMQTQDIKKKKNRPLHETFWLLFYAYNQWKRQCSHVVSRPDEYISSCIPCIAYSHCHRHRARCCHGLFWPAYVSLCRE